MIIDAALQAILLDLSGDSRPLAALLRNPAVPLGMAERRYLADKHEGRIKRPRNRPPHPAPLARGKNFKLACAVLILSEGKGRQLSAAVGDVAHANRCGESKVWAAWNRTKEALGEERWKQACKVARKGKTPVLMTSGADDDLPDPATLCEV